MATPSDDVSDQTFWYTAWITAEGELTADNVMEYFETSLFWDPSSTNAALKMQNQYSNLAQENTLEQLRKFTGVEFALVHAEPPDLFIIHKRKRLSPTEVCPIAAYFIMNNRIYFSPDIYSVISGRLRSSLNTLHNSLKTLNRYKPDFSPRRGHLWTVELEAVSNPLNGVPRSSHTSKTEATGESPESRSPKADPRPEPKSHSEIRPLLRALESTRRQQQMQLISSRISLDSSTVNVDTLASLALEPVREAIDASPQIPNTTTIGSSSHPSATATTFSPSSGARGLGSSQANTLLDVTPDSPVWAVQGLGAAGPSAPGGGKKKRKRQATVAQRATGASDPSQSVGTAVGHNDP